MARQHTLGTIKTVATRFARTAAHTAGHLGEQLRDKAVEEVSSRIAARRASTTPPTAPASRTTAPAATPAEAPPESASAPRIPSPTDVAKVVARNAAGLARVPLAPVRGIQRAAGPGAKLPARRGQGIVGV